MQARTFDMGWGLDETRANQGSCYAVPGSVVPHLVIWIFLWVTLSKGPWRTAQCPLLTQPTACQMRIVGHLLGPAEQPIAICSSWGSLAELANKRAICKGHTTPYNCDGGGWGARPFVLSAPSPPPKFFCCP